MNGLSWWYAEANAKGCTGSLASGWYNASLFDNETGRALPALYEMKSFLDNSTAIIPFPQKGVDQVTSFAEWYSIQGTRLPSMPSRDGIYLHGGQKVLLHH